MHTTTTDRLERLSNLAKRRGFAYASSDIYGSSRGAWDLGPLGIELKNNITQQWWRTLVTTRDDIVGLETTVINDRRMWDAVGRPDRFADVAAECQACHGRFRADTLRAEFRQRHGKAPAAGLGNVNCPACGTRGALTIDRTSTPFMSTHSGGNEAYLRPETLQGMVVNYSHVQQTARKKPPFGIATIGKSFRNEISCSDFLYRTREFTHMEMVFFVKPDSTEEWHQHWIDARRQWYVDLGVSKDHLRLSERQIHGAQRAVELQYHTDFIGAEWGAVECISNRTDTDLSAHTATSGVDLSYYDQECSSRWTPHAIVTSAGVERAMMCVLLDAFSLDEAPNTKGGMDERVVLRLDTRLAPVKVAVLPLSRNAELSPRGKAIAETLRQRWNVEFDDAGAIGRRYRRQDEIGTPYCLTLDFSSPDDGAVTIRERDSMRQERVSVDRLVEYFSERL